MNVSFYGKGGRTGKFADKTIGTGKSGSRTPVSEAWERKAQNQEDMRIAPFRNSEQVEGLENIFDR